MDIARLLLLVVTFFAARFFTTAVSSSTSDVGGESGSLPIPEASALKRGDTLVVPVPVVGEGDANLRAEDRVTRVIDGGYKMSQFLKQ
jgi:hypothetical protein